MLERVVDGGIVDREVADLLLAEARREHDDPMIFACGFVLGVWVTNLGFSIVWLFR